MARLASPFPHTTPQRLRFIHSVSGPTSPWKTPHPLYLPPLHRCPRRDTDGLTTTTSKRSLAKKLSSSASGLAVYVLPPRRVRLRVPRPRSYAKRRLTLHDNISIGTPTKLRARTMASVQTPGEALPMSTPKSKPGSPTIKWAESASVSPSRAAPTLSLPTQQVAISRRPSFKQWAARFSLPITPRLSLLKLTKKGSQTQSLVKKGLQREKATTDPKPNDVIWIKIPTFPRHLNPADYTAENGAAVEKASPAPKERKILGSAILRELSVYHLHPGAPTDARDEAETGGTTTPAMRFEVSDITATSTHLALSPSFSLSLSPASMSPVSSIRFRIPIPSRDTFGGVANRGGFLESVEEEEDDVSRYGDGGGDTFDDYDYTYTIGDSLAVHIPSPSPPPSASPPRSLSGTRSTLATLHPASPSSYSYTADDLGVVSLSSVRATMHSSPGLGGDHDVCGYGYDYERRGARQWERGEGAFAFDATTSHHAETERMVPRPSSPSDYETAQSSVQTRLTTFGMGTRGTAGTMGTIGTRGTAGTGGTVWYDAMSEQSRVDELGALVTHPAGAGGMASLTDFGRPTENLSARTESPDPLPARPPTPTGTLMGVEETSKPIATPLKPFSPRRALKQLNGARTRSINIPSLANTVGVTDTDADETTKTTIDTLSKAFLPWLPLRVHAMAGRRKDTNQIQTSSSKENGEFLPTSCTKANTQASHNRDRETDTPSPPHGLRWTMPVGGEHLVQSELSYLRGESIMRGHLRRVSQGSAA